MADNFVDYGDLGNFESKDYADINYYLDKFFTTPEEYQQYEQEIQQEQAEKEYWKEKAVNQSISFPSPNITGDKTIDLILVGLGIFMVLKLL